MNQTSLGEIVQKVRKEKAFTQEELASRAELDTRTIQRIEKGEVKPYFSTLKTLSKVLDFDLISAANSKPWQFSEEEMGSFREKFKTTRSIRIAIFIIGMSALLTALTTWGIPLARSFALSVALS